MDEAGAVRDEQPRPTVAFTPARLRRELWLDGLLRGAALLAILVLFFGLLGLGVKPVSLAAGVVWPGAGDAAWVAPLDTLVAVALIVGLWVWLALVNARVAKAMPGLSLLLDHDPSAGEAMLADLLKRRGLARWVRLMLYQRLATLRHRQERFAEAAAVAQSVLVTPNAGPADRGRGALLLLLLEARLELRDAIGAYLALVAVTQTPVSLTEALQRMALRTRYELMIGRDAAALEMAEQRLRLAELMPGPQCGALHAMMALAAKRVGDLPQHERWWKRVELLCSPEQVEQIRRLTPTP